MPRITFAIKSELYRICNAKGEWDFSLILSLTQNGLGAAVKLALQSSTHCSRMVFLHQHLKVIFLYSEEGSFRCLD